MFYKTEDGKTWMKVTGEQWDRLPEVQREILCERSRADTGIVFVKLVKEDK